MTSDNRHRASPSDDVSTSVPGEQRLPAMDREAADVRGEGSAARHIAQHFGLHDDMLRDVQSGRWSGVRIAEVLGVALADVASMIGVTSHMLAHSPDGEELQAALAPVANILAMLHDYFDGDVERVRSWIRQPQRRMDNRSTLDALRTPANAPLLEQWIAGVWLGDPE